MVDIAFTSFEFPATGTPTSRTMPDRLAEVKNVLDFGADPTGGNASATTAAIQAAVDAVSGADRGIIFFPLGQYTTNAPITLNYNGGLSIKFLGASGAKVGGFFSGFVFDRNNVNSGSPSNTPCNIIFDNLIIGNDDTDSSSGCVRIGSTIGAAFRDCAFEGQKCVTTEDSPGVSSENIFFENCKFTGPNNTPFLANGIIIGGTGAIVQCDFVALDVGVRAYGTGLHICGTRAENINTAYLFGLDSAGTDQGAHGFSLTSFSCEGDTTAVYLQGTCSAFVISGYSLGHPEGNNGYPFDSSGDSQYGLRVGPNCTAGFIQGYNHGQSATVAGLAVETASSRQNLFFLACTPQSQAGGGQNWILPTNAYTAFFQSNNIAPIWTFSQLPSGGDVVEGDEFNISDGTNGLNWGDVCTNTGTHTTHYLVRWNGSNWTVVGK